MNPGPAPSPPTTAPSAARLVPESGSWRNYVDSRNRTGEHGKTNAQTTGRVSSDAFVAHMRNLMRAPTLNVDVVSHCNL